MKYEVYFINTTKVIKINQSCGYDKNLLENIINEFKHESCVIIDITNCQYITSGVIAIIAKLSKHINVMIFAPDDEHIRETFEVIGFDKIFTIVFDLHKLIKMCE